MEEAGEQEEKVLTDEERTLLNELMMRRVVCRRCIQVASTADKSDPRRQPAIDEYNRQLSVLDGRIHDLTGKYPPTTISLKPAILFPEAGNIQGGVK